MRRRTFLAHSGRMVAGVLGARLSSGVPTTQAAPNATWPALIDALERRIPEWLEADHVPGLSIAIIRDARLAWRRGFGVKDRESRAPVDVTTMFEAASMSKPVFAYVVMKLVDEGRLDLDRPLTSYTTERFLDGDDRLNLITARHILSHTSGFQNWRSDAEPLSIHFTPGDKFLYSGEGYNYLQTVVTGLLGEPFERYMPRRLFTPFGMTSSGYVWTAAFAARMARPHTPDGQPFANVKSTPEGVARYGSAGALLTTPVDYARFVIEVMHPKRRDACRLGPIRTLEMLRPQIETHDSLSSSWALGWRVIRSGARDFFLHGGDNRGFHCTALWSVAGQSGYVAMTNGENGNSVMNKITSHAVMQQFLMS
jgi:CubicO group peptidase (beta-lactamase class C family)